MYVYELVAGSLYVKLMTHKPETGCRNWHHKFSRFWHLCHADYCFTGASVWCQIEHYCVLCQKSTWVDFSYWLLLSFSFSVFILEKSCVIKNLITVTFLCTKCSLGCRINFDSQSVNQYTFISGMSFAH